VREECGRGGGLVNPPHDVRGSQPKMEILMTAEKEELIIEP
jgi:hypothetical protein